MKLILLVLSALLALAAADTTTTADGAVTTVNPEVQCSKACNPKDVCCIAKCYKVPCPSDSQANDTNKCVAACPQGNGSPEDTKKYGDCEQRCYSSHFFPADGAQSATTGTTHGAETVVSGTAGNTGTTGTTVSGNHAVATQTGMTTTTSGSKSTNGEASKTGSTTSNTSTSHTTNAASNVKMGASGAGLFGLILAAFAL